MARYLGNNDSSDDDFSDNLQLAERLRINRDKTTNFRKKTFLDDQSSSSSSLEMQSDAHKDGSARTYSAYNKKRQNGDKSVEFFANPKRTCLGNRYLKSPDNQSKKKSRTVHYQNTDFPCSSSDNTSKHIFADKTYEDHLHNLAEVENPVFNSKQVSKRKFINCLNEHPKEDLACVQPKMSEYSKQHNDQSKQSKNKYSSSNSPKHFLWREPQNNLGEHSRVTVNGPRTAAFISTLRPEFSQDSPDGSIVHYVDSASDEDSRSLIKSGSLKGGRQSPELSLSSKKVLGRKVRKKVLDSDLDSDDDEQDWPTDSRSRPLIFSSSDSEVESGRKSVSKPPAVSESSDPYLFPVSDASRNSYESGRATSSHPHCYSRDNSVAGPSSSPISYSKSPRSFRSRKQIRTNNSSEISPNNFHSNNVGRRGRSRVNVGERYTRRTGSPHPRTLPNSHSRMTRSEVAKAGKGRSLSGSLARRANLNLATTYPDLFDAEDSSEVEFFTANSYSDTETSAESFGGLTISSTIRSPESNGIICEHSINIGSSEDEISVVFSSRPNNGEMERQVIRSAEPRRTLGRRRQRGSWRHRQDPVQEIVSLSPDPVEQVRQVEDDERFARILQAQFDAEVDPDYSPSPQPCSPPRPVVYSPYENIPQYYENIPYPINPTLRHSDNDLREENDGSRMRVQDPFPTVPFHDWRGVRLNRVPHRHPPPNFFGNIFLNNRRLDRTRRRRPTSINHLLEVGVFNALDDILYSDDSFETFLGIADLNGDVPRGLQKSEINRLPTRQFIVANNNAGSSNELPHKRAGLNKECQVCLSDYENGDTLRILPCFHEFHTPCIDPWLKINHTCPVCRVVVDLEG